MKTVEYKLLSFPGESVHLPKEAVNIGNDFMKKIKKSKDKNNLIKRINEYPALRDIAIEGGNLLRRANYVRTAKAESPRKKSFVDYIYLDLGMHYASGKRKLVENIDIRARISTLYSKLYSKYN